MTVFSTLVLFTGLFLTLRVGFCQTLIDEMSPSNEQVLVPELSSEKIQKISASKKIYIITNNSKSFQQGDFISLISNGSLVARALVAKEVDGLTGIKLLRIYSSELLGTLRAGNSIQILRGDDSSFKKKVSKKGKKIAGRKTTIEEEENLFDEVTLLEEEDLGDDENSKRIIKQDNILSLGLGRLRGQDLKGSSTYYNQINIAWSYQIADNIWAEALYGQNVVNDYPEVGLDTKLMNIVLKMKYTVKIPAHSYLQPYVGYQIVNPVSPGAGQQNSTGPVSSQQLQLELQRVENLETRTPVFGISVLKRLVPGWFAKADFGSDILGLGFALEF